MAVSNSDAEVEKVIRSLDVSGDEIPRFLTDDRILSIVKDTCDTDQIMSLSSRLNISHSVIELYKQTHNNSIDLGFDLLCLWRDINNLKEMESFLQLGNILNDIGCRFITSELLSSFKRWWKTEWINLYCNNPDLRSNIRRLINREIRRNTMSTDVSLYNHSNVRQSISLETLLEEFSNIITNEPTSIDKLHSYVRFITHLFYKYRPISATNSDITSCVSNTFTIRLKSVTSFLHEGRLMSISEQFPDSGTLLRLGICLNIPSVKLRKIINNPKNSVQQAAYYILYRWKLNCSNLREEGNVHELIEALKEIEYVELSEKLLEDYKSWQLRPIPVKLLDLQLAKIKDSNLGQDSLPRDVPSPKKISLKELPPPEE